MLKKQRRKGKGFPFFLVGRHSTEKQILNPFGSLKVCWPSLYTSGTSGQLPQVSIPSSDFIPPPHAVLGVKLCGQIPHWEWQWTARQHRDICEPTGPYSNIAADKDAWKEMRKKKKITCKFFLVWFQSIKKSWPLVRPVEVPESLCLGHSAPQCVSSVNSAPW